MHLNIRNISAKFKFQKPSSAHNPWQYNDSATATVQHGPAVYHDMADQYSDLIRNYDQLTELSNSHYPALSISQSQNLSSYASCSLR